jgi:hypothetical protein
MKYQAPSTIEVGLTNGACNRACVSLLLRSGTHRALRSIDPHRLLPFLRIKREQGMTDVRGLRAFMSVLNPDFRCSRGYFWPWDHRGKR